MDAVIVSGFTKLMKLQKIGGAYPTVPLPLNNGLALAQYDHDNYGFLRLTVSKTQIVGTYLSDRYVDGATPAAKVVDSFAIDLVAKKVKTFS